MLNASSDDRKVIDEREAAKRLNLGPMTLRRMRKDGTGPKHVMLGERRLGYRPMDLDAWLEARVSG